MRLQVSSDIYIPSLLSMVKDLDGATLDLVQLSVPTFLYGVSITQLLTGPLSEGIGRKIPLVVGLIVMGIGSANLCDCVGD